MLGYVLSSVKYEKHGFVLLKWISKDGAEEHQYADGLASENSSTHIVPYEEVVSQVLDRILPTKSEPPLVEHFSETPCSTCGHSKFHKNIGSFPFHTMEVCCNCGTVRSAVEECRSLPLESSEEEDT